MNDLMLDVETLGNTPETPVISIGAVFFDIDTQQLGDTFYQTLDINEQLMAGRKPTADTIKWWMGQAGAAKKVFSEQAQPVPTVLELFTKWFSKINPKAYVWGNGSTFDISIMEHLLRGYNVAVPWKYTNVMDLRTFRRFVADNRYVTKGGVNHHALDDAISQAKFVLTHTHKPGFTGSDVSQMLNQAKADPDGQVVATYTASKP